MNIRRQTGQIIQLMRATAVHIRATAVAAAIVLVAGCVGPAYVKPKVDTPSAFKESSPAAYTGADPGAWQPAQPQDAVLKGKWWEVFGEPELNTLEDQLNINNQNIAQFFQNFMAARAQVGIARASYFPTLTTAPSGTRTHTSGALGKNATVNTGGTSTGTSTGSGSVAGTSGSNLDIFQMPFDVSWEPDLWGRVRNTVRQARYAAQVSAADLENERLTEQAALAEFYFQLRGQDALQDLFNKTIEAQRKSLELTKVLVETGIDSPEDVAQAEVTLANTEATAVGVATNRAIYEHAIATLIGKPASDFSMPVKVLAAPLPITDYVAAVSVGVIGGQALLDLDYAEDSRAEVDMNIVRTGSGHYIEIQGTAESRPFTHDQMNEMTELASRGIERLVEEQRKLLGDLH